LSAHQLKYTKSDIMSRHVLDLENSPLTV